MEDFVEDIDTYEPDNPDVGTPVDRALAKRYNVSVRQVQDFLRAFEEEFDRIDELQRTR